MESLHTSATPRKRELTWDQVMAGAFPACQPLDAVEPGAAAPDAWQRAIQQAAEAAFADVTINTEPQRLASACDLALTQAVTLHADGTASVRNGKGRTYELAPFCDCQDSQRRSKWCKHYLSVYLVKQAHVLLGQQPPEQRNGQSAPEQKETTMAPDNGPETLAADWGRPAPRPSWRDQNPEHVHSMEWVDDLGIKHLHVIRADTCEDVMQEAAAVKALIRAARAASGQASAATPAAPAEGICALHGVQMTQGKGGDWFHKVGEKDGKAIWCRGTMKASDT